MMKFLSKEWIPIFFLLLVAGAVFARAVHFEDWMIIKADQIRDAMVSLEVVEEGVGALPLLGPKAGGTDLRLGPAFYYFQSASAFLFGSASPGVLALPVLLFSLLSIPLFFLVARRIFDAKWSLGMTAAFAWGFLGIEYSRFAWNPNMVPFFSLLFLYSFLNIVSGTSRTYVWYGLLGASYGIASQLHFTALFALPIFLVLFSVFRYSRIRAVWSWTGVGIALGAVFILYVPVLTSDLLSGGKNAVEFVHAIGSKESQQTMLDNVRRVSENFGENFFRIGFGYFGGAKWVEYAGLVLLLLGIGLSIVLFRRERDELRRDFFLAIPIWVLTFFVLFIPIATTINKPRFFLPFLFVPVLFFGMVSLLSAVGWKRLAILALSGMLLVASLGMNAWFVSEWLSEIRMSTHRYVSPKKDTVVLKMKKDTMWWSWGQIKQASEFMIKDCPHENILIEYKGQAADFMHTTLYAFRLAGDDRVRRSTKYDGPSFCKYTLTKSKPGGNAEDDQWDIGDLRIVLGDKRGGSFDTSGREEEEEKKKKKGYEHWRDVGTIFNSPAGE